MSTQIVVIGHGKLAGSILTNLGGALHRRGFAVGFIGNHDEIFRGSIIPGTSVMIHAGSGRQYDETMAYANDNCIPYIQACTRGEHEMPLPGCFRCVFVEAPNLSIPIIKFLHMLRQHGPRFSDYDVTVTESHQQMKHSVAGTAVEMGRYLGVHQSRILSIRDPSIQRDDLGIDNLGLHAYHILTISDSDCTITLETRVEGHAPYINGLAEIVLNLHRLERGYYRATDLVEAGIL